MALPDGFPDHAHRGFVTLTYLLPDSPGDLSHEDFLGPPSLTKRSCEANVVKTHFNMTNAVVSLEIS